MIKPEAMVSHLNNCALSGINPALPWALIVLVYAK
ncbi:hypothetical protein C7434_3055 [Pantoea sp. PNA 14-12]|nr:hypothetical protein C7434_3055 [Pantoea sp. PNA 14-12]